MKRRMAAACALLLAVALSGCATGTYRTVAANALEAAPREESAGQERMLIRRAWLSLEVDGISNAVTRIEDVTRRTGGHIESRSDTGDEQASLVLRVPAGALASAMADLETLGEVTSRRVSTEDVTGQYVDLDARFKTMVALRDRLRSLLEKAEGVKDVLAIEKELGRVQADIDAMQARLEALKGQVDLASIHVSLRRRRILGPLGYLFKGAWWTVQKLFVIRE